MFSNMNPKSPLPKEKKLTVIFRVEEGCLGPDGAQHVEGFCKFAQKEVETIDADFVHWIVVPRHDKALVETEYNINEKKLTHDKAERYLNLFEKSLDEFEGHFHEKISLLIEDYLH